MSNEVWENTSQFLKELSGGNKRRSLAVSLPDMGRAQKEVSDLEPSLRNCLGCMEASSRETVENYLEASELLFALTEEQAYCQGYVDCIQLLSGLGFLA